MNSGEDVLVFYNDRASFQALIQMMRSERDRMDENSQLMYHIHLVELLAVCTEGKNVYTEIKCNSLLPLDDIVRVVTHEDCVPEVGKCLSLSCLCTRFRVAHCSGILWKAQAILWAIPYVCLKYYLILLHILPLIELQRSLGKHDGHTRSASQIIQGFIPHFVGKDCLYQLPEPLLCRHRSGNEGDLYI